MHYQDDLVDMPHRLRLKDGTTRSTLEQRVATLERRVSELSDTLNGITNQLVDVSSSVHEMTHLPGAVSYTHLRAHETPEHLVCRLLLEKKKKKTTPNQQ